MIDQDLISNKSKQFEQEMGIKLQDAECEILKKLEYFHSHKFDDKKKEEYSKFLDHFLKIRYNKGRNALHLFVAYIVVAQNKEDEFFIPSFSCISRSWSALSSVAFHAKILSKQKDRDGETPLEFANRLVLSNNDYMTPARALAQHFTNIGIETLTTLSSDPSSVDQKTNAIYSMHQMTNFLPQLMELKYTIWRFRAVLGVFQSQTDEEEYVDRIANSGKDDVEKEKIRNDLEAKLIYRKKLFEAFKLGLESSTFFLETECNKKMKMVKNFYIEYGFENMIQFESGKIQLYFTNSFSSFKEANGFLNPLIPLFSKIMQIFPAMVKELKENSIIRFLGQCAAAENKPLLHCLIKGGININVIEISGTEMCSGFLYHSKKTPLDLFEKKYHFKDLKVKKEMIALLKENGALTCEELESRKKAHTFIQLP